jgi:cell division protein FtsL
MSARAIILTLLVCLLVGSAVALVFVQHTRRALLVELRSLQAQRSALEVEWGKLQIEEGTRLAQDNIERRAKDELAMRVPRPRDVVVVNR